MGTARFAGEMVMMPGLAYGIYDLILNVLSTFGASRYMFAFVARFAPNLVVGFVVVAVGYRLMALMACVVLWVVAFPACFHQFPEY